MAFIKGVCFILELKVKDAEREAQEKRIQALDELQKKQGILIIILKQKLFVLIVIKILIRIN